jgi:4-oxalocrotonate tautomerase
MSGEPNPETTKHVSALLVELTARILRKQPDVTAIVIDYLPEDRWFGGGGMLDQQGQRSSYFDIKVVEGINTKDEMARYIEAAFAGLKEILGEVHPDSYIHVQQVFALAYGYGGRTQENRYIASKLQTEAGTR